MGSLQHVEAAMPTSKGLVQIQYDRAGAGVQAEVTLPEGLSGDLLWKGRSWTLHGGDQRMSLP